MAYREEWEVVQEFVDNRIRLAEDALLRARDGNDRGLFPPKLFDYLVTQLDRAKAMIQAAIERLSANPSEH